MSNEIEITIVGKNTSGKAFKEVEQQASGLKKSLSGVGAVAGGILAAGAIDHIGERAKESFNSAISAASNLGESMNAVDRIFGSSSAEVKAWGEANAVSFGLSQRSFNEMATPLGAMLKNSGLQMKDVSTNTIELTKRAADMASVFNTDVGDALTAIQAGLRGESDPLERYGVGLSAAAVEARALADTGKTVTSSLTTQEKMAARVALIFDQTATSAGDFQATQDGLANATRIATAQMEEAQASIGQALLPVMAKVAQMTGNAAKAFAQLPGPVKTTIAVMSGLGAAVLIVIPRLIALKAALIEMGIVSSASTAKLALLAKGIGGLAIAAIGIDILGNAIEGLSGRSEGIDKLTTAMEGFAKTGKFTNDLSGQWAGVFGDGQDAIKNFANATRETLAPSFWETYFFHPVDEFSAILPGFQSNISEWSGKIGEMDQALSGMVASGNIEGAKQAFAGLAKAAAEQHVPLDQLKTLFPEYNSALGKASAANTALADTSHTAEIAVKSLKQTLDDATNTTFSYEQAQEGYEAAIDNATAALKKNKTGLDVHTEAGRANRAALRDIAVKAQDVLVSMNDLNRPMGQIVATSKNQRAAFISAATSMGLTRAAANHLADSYGLIPKNIKTNITQTGLAQARAAVEAFNRAWGGRTITTWHKMLYESRNAVIGGGQAHGGIIGSAATGGARGAETLVGEQGPEIVELPFGSRVIPAGTTRARMEGGSRGNGFQDVSTSFKPIQAQTSSIVDVIEKLVAALKEVVTLRGAIDNTTKDIFAQERALTGYEAAWDDATKAIKTNHRTLAMGTEKGRSNRDALTSLAQAALEVVSAMDDLNKSPQSIYNKMKEQRAEFIRMARAMGATAEQARNLADKYGLIPSKVKAAAVAEDRAVATNKKITASNKKIEAENAKARKLAGKASGGIAGGETLVGEDGPEIVDLPYGSMVYPHGQSEAMGSPTGGGGGGEWHITLKIGDHALGELVLDPLRKSIRTRGGDVQAVLGRR